MKYINKIWRFITCSRNGHFAIPLFEEETEQCPKNLSSQLKTIEFSYLSNDFNDVYAGEEQFAKLASKYQTKELYSLSWRAKGVSACSLFQQGKYKQAAKKFAEIVEEIVTQGIVEAEGYATLALLKINEAISYGHAGKKYYKLSARAYDEANKNTVQLQGEELASVKLAQISCYLKLLPCFVQNPLEILDRSIAAVYQLEDLIKGVYNVEDINKADGAILKDLDEVNYLFVTLNFATYYQDSNDNGILHNICSQIAERDNNPLYNIC